MDTQKIDLNKRKEFQRLKRIWTGFAEDQKERAGYLF